MLRKDLTKKSPAIRIMGMENLHKGKFGTVLSRAGVGKTQFLVQIALSWLLEGENILHISLDDPMDNPKLPNHYHYKGHIPLAVTKEKT